MSQYDGIFGQLSFSTANFMGRGETFTVSMQTGARVSDYQIAFTEPFLFDRPITGSVDIHKRNIGTCTSSRRARPGATSRSGCR